MIGKNIKTARLTAEMTLEELGNKIGVSRGTVHKYENGMISNIPSDKIEKIAEATSVTASFLMGWEEKQSEECTELNNLCKQLNNLDITVLTEQAKYMLTKEEYKKIKNRKKETA